MPDDSWPRHLSVSSEMRCDYAHRGFDDKVTDTTVVEVCHVSIILCSLRTYSAHPNLKEAVSSGFDVYIRSLPQIP